MGNVFSDTDGEHRGRSFSSMSRFFTGLYIFVVGKAPCHFSEGLYRGRIDDNKVV